jgi:hypothetical protein
MTKRILDILTDLERVRENLLALSDDIWMSIDHNDSQAMREGVEFKGQYNEKLADFDRLAGELSKLVQQFTKVQVEEEEEQDAADVPGDNQRIIRELDKETPHSLDEDFTYKRPFGFVLGEFARKDIVTWRRMYELTCRHLAQLKPEVFRGLPTNPSFVSRRGNPSFATDPGRLRAAMRVSDEIYAEINLSANSLRDNMRELLQAFGLPADAMRVYLREDRDADE